MGGQAAGHEDGHEKGKKCVLIDLSQSDDEAVPCVALAVPEKAAVPKDNEKKKQRVRRVVFPQVSDATAVDFNATAVGSPMTSKDFNATAVGSLTTSSVDLQMGSTTSKGSLTTSKGSAVDFNATAVGSPKNSQDFDISDDDKPLRDSPTTSKAIKTDGLILPRAFFDTLLVLIDETREACGMEGDFDSVPPAVLVIAATRWLAIVGRKPRAALEMQAEFLEALGTADDFQKSNEKQLGRYIPDDKKADFKKYVGKTYDDFTRRVASCNA
jgi:hypothetical protein